MYFEDDEIDGYIEGAPIVMISSSMYGFEDQILTIKDYFHSLKYNVITSLDGTIMVDPRLGNFGNCLKAVESCDVFFGVIRPFCGTGRSNEESITFKEFKHARSCHKPSWYVVDNRVKYFKDLFFALKLRRDCGRKDINEALEKWVEELREKGEDGPKILDLFCPDRSRRYFDPECFLMEDFVNQKDVPRDMVTNNWMQYVNNILDIKRYVETNFRNQERVMEIIKEG